MSDERGSGLLVLGLLFISSCASPAVEFEGRYWYPDLDLEAKIEDGGFGTRIDFDDDLDLDDEDFPVGRVKLFTGENSWIRAEYIPISYDGDSMLTRTIFFNGKPFIVGTRVITDFDFEYYRLGWGSQFISLGDGFFKFGTLIEAKGYNLDASLISPTTGIAESEDITFGLPTVGVILDINPADKLNFYGEISGITAGSYGYTIDAEAGVKFIPFKNFTLTCGYRYLTFDVEWDDDEADMTLAGAFVGGSLRF